MRKVLVHPPQTTGNNCGASAGQLTVHHAERVGAEAAAVAKAFGRDEDDVDVLYRGGVHHDVGKIRSAMRSYVSPDR